MGFFASRRLKIQGRGEPGDRRLRDAVSGTGKYARKIRVNHPVAIIRYWVAVAHGSKANLRQIWKRYEGEIARINRGDSTGRKDDQGNLIHYPKPTQPYVCMSYWAFRRLKKKTPSKPATASRHSPDAARSEWGGGGVSEIPTHLGSHLQMDDTRLPVLAKIDIRGEIWVGQPTFTHIFDPWLNAIPGWDLSWDEASSATVLRTIAHASTPKAIPKDLDAKYPQLKAIFYLGDSITHDNLSAHHANTVVDALKDVRCDTNFTGSGIATDKSAMERSVGTVLEMAFRGLPCSVEAIALRRWQKGDPSPDLLPTIGRLRTLLTRAICTLHLTRTSGVSGRVPLLEFIKATAKRKANIIHDIDQFTRAIGMVEYDVSLSAHGIVLFSGHHRLRYADAVHGSALFERIRGVQRSSKRGGDGVPVKVKYHPDNLLWIHVWDPVEKRYVDLKCDQPDYARDLPKWMHDIIIASIGEEAQEFIPEETLIEFQKRLFDQQAHITQAAEERERRIAAKVIDSPVFKRVMGQVVQVEDEDPLGTVEPHGVETFDHLIGNDLSAVTALDAEQPTPRPASANGQPSRRRPPRQTSTSHATRHQPQTPTRRTTREAAGTAAATGSIKRPERPRPPSSRGKKWNL